ncbi:splicing factor U2af large subunit B-like [Papaver somniferum]|uniref:splicing factor U2af large subunit B-like n=1 Tax=Papaver somniferum TaxID=3469 RepID=UPI000E7017F8|nr:splicing factor U2af large subunit B-like [Papaver somniferum]
MAVMIGGGDFCSSVQKKSISTHAIYDGAEDTSDSCERGPSKSRERKRDRDKDHDRSERDHHRLRNTDRRERSETNRDDGYHHRDHGRRRSYDRDSDEERYRRSRSRSRRDSEEERPHRRSRSRSRSKRKRNSGFDVAPPSIDGVAAAPPTIPGTFPINMMYMTQQATRHARRVYVGGLPPMANEEESVATFFNQVMSAIGGNTAGPGDAVVNVYINHEKNFAFVEMRSVEEASNAMALDGIVFQGVTVKVRRPTDYNPSLAAALGPSQPSLKLNLEAVGMLRGSTACLEGPDRIFVGGIPSYFTEVQIRELLESFGSLRGFDLVKDKETGNSKGFSFCVYQDTSITDIVCGTLNGLKLGSKTLTVRRANQGTTQPKPEHENALLGGALPTKVVRLTHAVSADELKDDEEYEDIVEDMRLEAGKYGSLTSVVIPRPIAYDEPSPGVGSVFLEFSDTIGAWKAREGLNGRKFGGNEVVAVYYPEIKFSQGEYDA